MNIYKICKLRWVLTILSIVFLCSCSVQKAYEDEHNLYKVSFYSTENPSKIVTKKTKYPNNLNPISNIGVILNEDSKEVCIGIKISSYYILTVDHVRKKNSGSLFFHDGKVVVEIEHEKSSSSDLAIFKCRSKMSFEKNKLADNLNNKDHFFVVGIKYSDRTTMYFVEHELIKGKVIVDDYTFENPIFSVKCENYSGESGSVLFRYTPSKVELVGILSNGGKKQNKETSMYSNLVKEKPFLQSFFE